MKTEVTLTYDGLKKLWAGIVDDPYEHNDGNEFWDFVYETGRCADVLKAGYLYIEIGGSPAYYANDDANEILCHMERYWRESQFEKYAKAHPEIHEAYNEWWWSNHDVEDYLDE